MAVSPLLPNGSRNFIPPNGSCNFILPSGSHLSHLPVATSFRLMAVATSRHLMAVATSYCPGLLFEGLLAQAMLLRSDGASIMTHLTHFARKKHVRANEPPRAACSCNCHRPPRTGHGPAPNGTSTGTIACRMMTMRFVGNLRTFEKREKRVWAH